MGGTGGESDCIELLDSGPYGPPYQPLSFLCLFVVSYLSSVTRKRYRFDVIGNIQY